MNKNSMLVKFYCISLAVAMFFMAMGLGACGTVSDQGGSSSSKSNPPKTNFEDPDNGVTEFEVKLKDGRILTCVQYGSISCDWANAR